MSIATNCSTTFTRMPNTPNICLFPIVYASRFRRPKLWLRKQQWKHSRSVLWPQKQPKGAERKPKEAKSKPKGPEKTQSETKGPKGAKGSQKESKGTILMLRLMQHHELANRVLCMYCLQALRGRYSPLCRKQSWRFYISLPVLAQIAAHRIGPKHHRRNP